MLKALEDLERAVGRLVKKTGEKAPVPPHGKGGAARGAGRGGYPDRTNEEAAELIRRALKRLRSL